MLRNPCPCRYFGPVGRYALIYTLLADYRPCGAGSVLSNPMVGAPKPYCSRVRQYALSRLRGVGSTDCSVEDRGRKKGLKFRLTAKSLLLRIGIMRAGTRTRRAL